MRLSRFRYALWPARLPPVPEPQLVPGEPILGETVALEHARYLLDRQNSVDDALDGKAATLVSADLIVLGLVLTQVSIGQGSPWTPVPALELAFLLLLLGTVGHSLVTAVAAYGVIETEAGWSATDLPTAMTFREEDARAALAIKLAQAYVQNAPLIKRKAEFVRISLRALLATALFVVVLFVFGGFA